MLRGIFRGGGNADMISTALKDDKPPRKEFPAAKVFLSAGKDDPIAGPGPAEAVRASLKKSGFSQLRLEVAAGAHRLCREHVAQPWQWFADSAASK